MSAFLDGTVALPHLGVIRASGEDAGTFLHGQLTQDIAQLGSADARLAAFCNAKGRMLASFVALRQDGDVLLVCSRDLLPATLKRLSMFVLRARAKLTDASDLYAVHGVAGAALRALAGEPKPPWTREDAAGGSLVHLYPAQDTPRGLWIAAAGTPPPVGAGLSADAWAWSEVQSGVATLSAAVVEAFVPQMLNYESIGGVNFKKGCYPGQEVVARSQFRGTLKRRAFVAHSPGALGAGQEVFPHDSPDQPAGMVVQVAPAPGGGTDAIVSLQLAAAERAGLHAGSVTGPPLQLLPLPYLLLADV